MNKRRDDTTREVVVLDGGALLLLFRGGDRRLVRVQYVGASIAHYYLQEMLS